MSDWVFVLIMAAVLVGSFALGWIVGTPPYSLRRRKGKK